MTTEEIRLYRAYGGESGPISKYWSTVKPEGPMQAKLDSALPPGNTATEVSEIVVPKEEGFRGADCSPLRATRGRSPGRDSKGGPTVARSMTPTGAVVLAAEAVQQFFDRILLASLELPDGWFAGRRGESLHELTMVIPRPRRLLVELDGQLLLSFSEVALVSIDGEVLTISRFDQLVFDWQSYGQNLPEVRVFGSGTVRLVSQ